MSKMWLEKKSEIGKIRFDILLDTKIFPEFSKIGSCRWEHHNNFRFDILLDTKIFPEFSKIGSCRWGQHKNFLDLIIVSLQNSQENLYCELQSTAYILSFALLGYFTHMLLTLTMLKTWEYGFPWETLRYMAESSLFVLYL